MSKFAHTGKVITIFPMKPITLSLRPGVKSMDNLVKGHLLRVGGISMGVINLPKYPVLRFLSASQYKKEVNSINSPNVVKETLTTLNGGQYVVYYVKDHSKMRKW